MYQLTEEQAREMFDIIHNYNCVDDVIEEWKKMGFVVISATERAKEMIKNIRKGVEEKDDRVLLSVGTVVNLIDIVERAFKELENE